MKSAGINGFGRFGLHLLKYWIERINKCKFSIDYINDKNFNILKILNIINTDKYCKINRVKFVIKGKKLVIKFSDGTSHSIIITNQESDKISWIGKVDFFLECSGKNTKRANCKKFLNGKTKKVIISATSWDCDKTIVYGFNEREISTTDKIISYGSCTVNAYVPLANFINNRYRIYMSDVNVIHNIQSYKLKNFNTLVRKFCTLETSGPNMLKFLNKGNFNVNYTIVPYDGVSIIDFKFSLKKKTNLSTVIKSLKHDIKKGSLKNLYSIKKKDAGPEPHKFSTNSAVMIEDSIKLRGKSLYISCYFDNENSVNRFYDTVNYICN
jgi:glyceraldehyde 3-phosphate dehydrogenase